MGRCLRRRRRRDPANVDAVESGNLPWLERQLGRGLAAALGVADESQDNTEADRGQKASVLLVCNLPDLRDDRRVSGVRDEGEADSSACAIIAELLSMD